VSDPEQVTDPGDPLVAELAERQRHHRLQHRYDDADEAAAAALALVEELLPDSRLLRTADGWLWLGPDGEHTPVFDARAVDPGRVAALRDLATSVAGAPLAASVLPGEPTREAFVADGSFVRTATSMRLDLRRALPGDHLADRVEVSAMTAAEVASYAAGAIESYAASRVEAGESAALALATSRASFDELLPGGRPGPDQHLMSVRAGGTVAGLVWVCERWPAQAWVYDVEVDPAFRGRGIGAAAMVHGARLARDLGYRWLGLNVFGPNTHARALYERLGFVVEEEHWARTRPQGQP
jgi:ribosomal protein S18 acetylase RimI-like enzyme